MVSIFCVLLKKYLPTPGSRRYVFRGFIIIFFLPVTFRPMIHLELNSVYVRVQGLFFPVLISN